MNNLIETINQNTKEYFDYYDLMNYFRNNPSSLSQIICNACSYEINNFPNSLNESLLPNFYSKEFTKDNINLLDSIVNKLENSFLKARIYHLLFLNREKRHRDDAINAINLYQESITKLIEKNIHLAFDFLFIAIYLGTSIKFQEQSYILAKKKIIDLFEEMKLEDPITAFRALDIINRLEIMSKKDIIKSSDFIADKLISKNEYGKAILALKIVKNKTSPNMREKLDKVNRKISNCYIAIAHSYQGLQAAHYLLNAINSLAQIKNTRQERLSLYEEMRDYQIEAMLDFKYHEIEPYDISNLLEDTRNRLENSQSLFDMLFKIACCICDIIEIDELKRTEEQLEKIFLDLFYQNRIYIDHQGINMSVGEVPSIIDFGNSSEKDKQSLWSKIVERMKIHHQISCLLIQESLEILNLTYKVKYTDILDLCENNPFIPLNHEELFAKGILAGLNNDFMTACHLLIPQIENSLRHLLELRAEEPTSLHANNEQERNGLKSLLENTEIINILGIDGVIHLRTLLLDKRYPGLRHSIAHGFLGSAHFYGSSAIYTWWLIFRIIMISHKDYWEENYCLK